MSKNFEALEIETTGWCPLNCKYCVSGDTKILMADGTWKEIKDVYEGDKIVGVTEFPINGSRRVVEAVVEAVHSRIDDLYEVILENGVSIKVTDNHPLLGEKWMQINVNRPSDAPEKYKLSEGERVLYVDESVRSSMGESLIPVFTKVKEIHYIGKTKVYNLMTSSRTYISNGLISHNCYIPKTDGMKRMHFQILQRLKGELKDELLEFNGDTMHLGLWGTEPALSIVHVLPMIQDLIKNHGLKNIGYSSSMILEPKAFEIFLKGVNGLGLQKVSHQISLDGPPWVTDVNRAEGAMEKILKNTAKLIDIMNEVDLDYVLEFTWKATLTEENIRKMVENPPLIDEYFIWFDKVTKDLQGRIKNRKIRFLASYSPTLVVPGKYTKEDGEYLAKFFEYMLEKGYPNTYIFRWLRIWNFRNELYKMRMFTCSGGDSNVGFDGEHVHICHRTFYWTRDEYMKAIMEMDKYKNWDVSLLNNGVIENVRKWYIVDRKDELNLTRFKYVMRGYHDFIRFRLSASVALIKELAAAGQILPIYGEDDKKAELFALFLHTAHSCPIENVINTGSVHLIPISLYRMFGNGAFEVVMEGVRRMVA